jgi:glutamate N-acetyltransferase/amino-acid N-acetyltransferase
MSWSIELMAVNLSSPEAKEILAIKGIRLATANAGIKKNGCSDLVLIEISKGSTVSTLYTQNAFCAAPVTIAKQHQNEVTPLYLLVNSGNANAGTGQQGLKTAIASCEAIADEVNEITQAVLPFSTGVIGEQLPLDKIKAAIPKLVAALGAERWLEAAQGIMTTDTVAKAVSKQVKLAGKLITVTGIAKGSGMIRPDMATLLSYIATDAAIAQNILDLMLKKASAQSFNRISVDGDTSTNDACVLMATGKANNALLTDFDTSDSQTLYKAIAAISQELAHAVVRDGEGATKFITVEVEQGTDTEECRQVAYTIAHSPLVKTALFASDPNWGRILAAVGRSGLNDFDLTQVAIYLDDVCVIKNGEPAVNYTEALGQQVMNQEEIMIRVILKRGKATDTIWTCDFSYDYVKINAEYRT